LISWPSRRSDIVEAGKFLYETVNEAIAVVVELGEQERTKLWKWPSYLSASGRSRRPGEDGELFHRAWASRCWPGRSCLVVAGDTWAEIVAVEDGNALDPWRLEAKDKFGVGVGPMAVRR